MCKLLIGAVICSGGGREGGWRTREGLATGALNQSEPWMQLFPCSLEVAVKSTAFTRMGIKGAGRTRVESLSPVILPDANTTAITMARFSVLALALLFVAGQCRAEGTAFSLSCYFFLPFFYFWLLIWCRFVSIFFRSLWRWSRIPVQLPNLHHVRCSRTRSFRLFFRHPR